MSEKPEYFIRFGCLEKGRPRNLRTAYLDVYIRARVIFALISRFLLVDGGIGMILKGVI